MRLPCGMAAGNAPALVAKATRGRSCHPVIAGKVRAGVFPAS